MSDDERVYPRAPERPDREEFTALMRVSRAFHSPWATAPTDDERFVAYLADTRRTDFEAMLLCRSEDDAIIGFFNLSQIVRQRLQSAYLGYAAGQPFAGQGYMREGIEHVLRHAFVTLQLHRIEANIQPGNASSLALASGAGFRREGFSPATCRSAGGGETTSAGPSWWRSGTPGPASPNCPTDPSDPSLHVSNPRVG
jgi:ribosomal-protein-alanine N-acetyltransferase